MRNKAIWIAAPLAVFHFTVSFFFCSLSFEKIKKNTSLIINLKEVALSKINRSCFSHSSKSYVTDLYFPAFPQRPTWKCRQIDKQNNFEKKNGNDKKIRNIFLTQILPKFIFSTSFHKLNRSIKKMCSIKMSHGNKPNNNTTQWHELQAWIAIKTN